MDTVPPIRHASQKQEQEKAGLLATLQELLELPMVALSLIMLVLFVIEVTLPIPKPWVGVFRLVNWFIWVAFVIEFVVKLSLAPNKPQFVLHNWLMALSVILPVLRVARIFRAARALRSIGALRVMTLGNRTISKLGILFERRRLQYLALVAGAMILLAGAGVYYMEQGAANSNIRTFGDGLWWAAGTVTTVGTEKYPVTPEGRVLAFITMVFGLGVFSYIAGSLASTFLRIDLPDDEDIPSSADGQASPDMDSAA